MKLTILTPEKSLTEELPVEKIIVPGNEGEMCILDKHAHLITTLREGIVSYIDKKGRIEKAAIGWGYCQVFPNRVTILAETAERKGDLEEENIKKAIKEIEKRLLNEKLDGYEIKRLHKDKKKNQIRLRLFS